MLDFFSPCLKTKELALFATWSTEYRQDNGESPNIGLRENSSDTESEVNDMDPDGLVNEEGFWNDGSSDYTDQDQDSSDESTINPEDFFVQMVSAVDIAREHHRKGNKASVDKFDSSIYGPFSD